MTDLSSQPGGWPAPVLHVAATVDDEGCARTIADTVEALAAIGAPSAVASAGGAAVREIERAGARHVRLPLNSPNPIAMARNADALTALAGEIGARIVHVHRRAPAWSARKAAKRAGAFFVGTARRPYNESGFVAQRLSASLLKADRVIAVSDFVADHIKRGGKIDPSAIRVVRQGVDVDRFNPASVTGARVGQAAQRLNLPDDAQTVMVPLFTPRHAGTELMVEALTRLGRNDVIGLFLGWSEDADAERREVDALIANRSLEAAIHLAPPPLDRAATLMLADVVVIPTMARPGTARSILEAQALGRPVIVADEAAAREFLLPGISGWTFPPGDAAALAELLAVALDLDSLQRDHVAAAAGQNVRTNFDRRIAADYTLGVYRELIQGRPLWAE